MKSILLPGLPSTAKKIALVLFLLVLVLVVMTTESSYAAPGDITRVSVDSNDNEGNGRSQTPSMSADGRYVAFASYASNLVGGDTNGTFDVFVRDQGTGTTERVSLDSNGNQGNGASGRYGNGYGQIAISADGRYVAFESGANNLVANDTNSALDVFVRDRQAGTTERVSLDSDGEQGNGASGTFGHIDISFDGRYVAFESWASNLVANDTNNALDVFVRDRQAGTTERVSLDSNDKQGNGWGPHSSRPSISFDGRYVAFESWASNLVANDTNGQPDVFVRDRQAGTTERVSLGSSDNQANSASAWPSISADGRYVAFYSGATNLVAGDTNSVDVFVRDRQAGTTEQVSLDSSDNLANSASAWPSISADGRYVAFASYASNLVANDTNNALDVFVRDRQTETTERMSVDSNGNQGNIGSSGSSISANGRYVAFHSLATNLVANDTNGTYDVFVHKNGDEFDDEFDDEFEWEDETF